jgi:hypothetical protein
MGSRFAAKAVRLLRFSMSLKGVSDKMDSYEITMTSDATTDLVVDVYRNLKYNYVLLSGL